MEPDADSGRKRIFIVVDHPEMREWLATLINHQSDLKVCGEAGNAAEALHLIATSKPRVAVVDISMERDSRVEVIKNIQATCPKVAVIVLSMHDGRMYGERSLRAGSRGYVMKRETARKVLQAIRCVLDGKLCLINEMTRMLAGKFVEGGHFAPGFPVDLISDRQLEVFKLLGCGYSNTQIAQELHVSVNTVRTFCARIKEKLKLSNARKLLREAVLWHDRQNLRKCHLGSERAVLAGASRHIKEQKATKNGLHAIRVRERIARMMDAKVVEGNSPETDSVVEQLSHRELEVFRLLGRGCSNQQIAEEMHVSFKTVHSFRGRIKEKLKLSSATEVPREAWRWHEKMNLK